MRKSVTTFVLGLGLMSLVFTYFGVKKAALGVDFTDEGFYVSAPLKLLFGEPIFSSELVTLTRPFELLSYGVLRLFPETTLYQLRLLGWGIHILGYAAICFCCFRTSRSPILSLMVPAIPFFASNAYALITPSYNNLSSDGLLMAMSLRVAAATIRSRVGIVLGVASGCCLFAASTCYPPLAIAALFLIVADFASCRFNIRLLPRIPSSIAASLSFVACGAIGLACLTFSGALQRWFARFHLIGGSMLTAYQEGPGRFYLQLFTFLVSSHALFIAYSIFTLLVLLSIFICRRVDRERLGRRLAAIYASVSGIGFILAFPGGVSVFVTFMCIAALGATGIYFMMLFDTGTEEQSCVRVCLLATALTSLAYATSTAFFGFDHAWFAAAFALPFAFSVTMVRFFQSEGKVAWWHRLVPAVVFSVSAFSGAIIFYNNIYRDGPVETLTASFSAPKLRNIRSTPARVRMVDQLYDYLRPRLVYGEPLIVYDSCSMLYFLFDAHPVYGLTWAKQYRISHDSLIVLNQELLAKSLPEYAVKVIADPSSVEWSATGPRQYYSNYPLDNTVNANYRLERTLFPFEVWHRK